MFGSKIIISVLVTFASMVYSNFLNPLSANPTKSSNTLKQFVGNLLTNCLSVLDHFAKLALKWLRDLVLRRLTNGDATDINSSYIHISVFLWCLYFRTSTKCHYSVFFTIWMIITLISQIFAIFANQPLICKIKPLAKQTFLTDSRK